MVEAKDFEEEKWSGRKALAHLPQPWQHLDGVAGGRDTVQGLAYVDPPPLCAAVRPPGLDLVPRVGSA